METIIRQVRELPEAERSTAERLVGHSLQENQQLIIQIATLGTPVAGAVASDPGKLPDWTRVYDGLSDDEIAVLETAVLQRANLSRSSE
jgi:hypothetical protein